jgi:hypothetical protein
MFVLVGRIVGVWDCRLHAGILADPDNHPDSYNRTRTSHTPLSGLAPYSHRGGIILIRDCEPPPARGVAGGVRIVGPMPYVSIGRIVGVRVCSPIR